MDDLRPFNTPTKMPKQARPLSRALKLELLAGIRVHNGEGHAGLIGVGVVERVPEGVALAEELAADLVPVGLGVGRGGDSVAALGAADGPAGLSNLEAQVLASLEGREGSWLGAD